MINLLSGRNNIVLATVGALSSMKKSHTTEERGLVVYLCASIKQQVERTARDRHRPLPQNGNPEQIIKDLMVEREPLYLEVADFVVDTNRRNPKSVSNEIIKQIKTPAISRFMTVKLSARVFADEREAQDTVETLNVDLGERSYPIFIGPGLLKETDRLRSHLGQGQAVIISNDTVAPLYLDQVKQTLGDSYGWEIILPDGETHKTLGTVSQIYDRLLRAKADRQTTLVALGGGVIGDITGFAAATYQRGINFIQIPTTLLAQVDSSVGGKTGVNHPLGKNMIGAFINPDVS